MKPVGRPEKDWPIKRRSIPEELWPEIKKRVQEWEIKKSASIGETQLDREK